MLLIHLFFVKLRPGIWTSQTQQRQQAANVESISGAKGGSVFGAWEYPSMPPRLGNKVFFGRFGGL